MAHEVASLNGSALMAYTGATPWHGLGVHFEDAPSIEDVIRVLAADRVVEKRQLFLAGGQVVPGAYSTVRIERDGKVSPLGVVGERYHVGSDVDALHAFAPLLATGATLETAGYLRDGATLFATAKLPGFQADVVKGDTVESYAMMAHAHDGTMPWTCGRTTTRVVCRNTLRAAIGDKGSHLLKFRHTKSARGKVATVGEILARHSQEFAKQVEIFRALSKRPMSDKDFRTFVQALIPAPVASTPAKPAPVVVNLDEIADATENDALTVLARDSEEKRRDPRAWDALCALYMGEGKGSALPGVAGTAWGAFNAVTEYVTHHQARTPEAAFFGSQAGPGALLTEKAMVLLTK